MGRAAETLTGRVTGKQIAGCGFKCYGVRLRVAGWEGISLKSEGSDCERTTPGL